MYSDSVEGISWKRIDDLLIFSGTGPMPDTETEFVEWPDPWGSDDDTIMVPTDVSPWSHGGNMQWAKTIIINEGITAIGRRAFNAFDCEKIVLPHSLRIIRSRAFANCRSLKHVIIPEGVVTIEFDAFYDCTSLKTMELPDTTTDISLYMYGTSNAFGNNKNLIIKAHKGTYAETYAREAGYHFESV